MPWAVLLGLLTGCDAIPGLGTDAKAVQKEADSKAIGGACRYGLRSIEDCYNLNPKASKAQVFAGWKDMDQYMRDNKIDGVETKVSGAQPDGEGADKATPKSDTKAETAPSAKAADKSTDKSPEKPAKLGKPAS